MGVSNLFWKEVVENLRVKRSLAVKFLLPLLFLLPVALPSVPMGVKASMLPLAALFLGVFGSSIGLVRMRETKMVPRLAMLPRSSTRLIADYLAANVLMDLAQLALPAAMTLLLLDVGAPGAAQAIIGLVSAVVAANAIGVLVATLAGSSGEVHLYAALVILLVGGASGLFIVGASVFDLAGLVSPFTALSLLLGSSTVPAPQLGMAALGALAVLLLSLVLSDRFLHP